MMIIICGLIFLGALKVTRGARRGNRRTRALRKYRNTSVTKKCIQRTKKRIEAQQRQIEKERENAVEDFYKMLEADAKEEEKTRQLYYKIEKADDEIAHYSKLLKFWNGDREELMEEYEEVLQKIELVDSDLEPLEAIKTDKYDGDEGMALYMDLYGKALDDKKSSRNQKRQDLSKLVNRKRALENKLIQTNNKIFSTKQRIKKAMNDRENAQKRLEEVA